MHRYLVDEVWRRPIGKPRWRSDAEPSPSSSFARCPAGVATGKVHRCTATCRVSSPWAGTSSVPLPYCGFCCRYGRPWNYVASPPNC